MEASTRKALWVIAGGILAVLALISGIVYFGVITPVKTYISQEAFPIEHVPVSPKAEQRVLDTVQSFFQNMSADTLVLNGEQVNHLVRTSPVIADYGVQYLVELQDSLFNIKCSAPVGVIRTHMSGLIEFLGLEGWINMEMEGYLRLRDGNLNIITTRSQMNGREAPFTMLGTRTHKDLGDFFLNREQYDEQVARIRFIGIRKGTLFLIISAGP